MVGGSSRWRALRVRKRRDDRVSCGSGGGGEGRARCGADTEEKEGGVGGAASRFRAAVPEFQTVSMSMIEAEESMMNAEDASTTYSKPEFTLILPFVIRSSLSPQIVILIAFQLALPSRTRAQTHKCTNST
ncbi:hypothetical protein C8R45DRAFT_1110710 [Mycena sanguinolenta]|nr:hypothetical protein C8R45DRAFT_1110710 [Mycena sanguinolenta]